MITIILIMKVISLLKSLMIVKDHGKILMYFAEKDSLRVFLLNMVLLLMMKLQEYEMADLEVQQRMNRRVLCGSEVKIKKII